jgi:predicted O-methyltransferase YrrM
MMVLRRPVYSLNAQAAHFSSRVSRSYRVATRGRVQHEVPVIVQPIESTLMLAWLAQHCAGHDHWSPAGALGSGARGGVRSGDHATESLHVSTNLAEDQIYLSQPDTAFLSKARITDWETDKTFSTDWAGNHFFFWAELLHPLREKPVRILEIGSWEGRSALFFLNYLPLSCITCIDTFGGNVEHHLDPHFQRLALKTEAQFDSNLAAYAHRVEKIKGSSTTILPTLGISGRRFDLAYVDGSHMAADVYSDAVLTWPMMEPGGLVIFDDYEWDLMSNDRQRPRLGIDAFLAVSRGHYRELHRAYQLVIAKL